MRKHFPLLLVPESGRLYRFIMIFLQLRNCGLFRPVSGFFLTSLKMFRVARQQLLVSDIVDKQTGRKKLKYDNTAIEIILMS